ncbi:phosphate signaling complex protein PhoU [Stenoxybacter acetivorans]|uniref:phosphate signaling complex protein PhoU n=1 Tax=Stenoxybacter acetivorans TaxID=422441 RepID=UPI000568C065|nr:phosphate signaling complex protein PhoU [Stenoxybacter acetivorans]
MSKHTSTQFHQELENVRTHVMQMGGLVERQVSVIQQALSAMAMDTLQTVIESDKEINEMELLIDDECQSIIARRQPTAGDLRLILAVSRITIDLERIGDEVKKAALIAHDLLNQERVLTANFYHFNRMCHHAGNMLHQALDAFARIDAATLLSLLNADRELDHDYRSQIRNLISHMTEDARNISTGIELMSMNRAVERIGDHAVNIAEHVVYLAKGIDVRHTPEEKVEEALNQEN